jgi:hypothetical protein
VTWIVARQLNAWDRAAMKKHFLVSTITAVVLCSSCVTDDKGESCGLLDALYDNDGNTFCPDENAPADCETLFDVYIDAAVACASDAGIPITEEDVRADEALPDCDNAVATRPSFDDCIDDIEGAACETDGTLPLPDTCKGAVLTS